SSISEETTIFDDFFIDDSDITPLLQQKSKALGGKLKDDV
ncbi:1499_t:CDS:1, partial [Funneliformis mosseae]